MIPLDDYDVWTLEIMFPLANGPHDTEQLPFIRWVAYSGRIQFPARECYGLEAGPKVLFQDSTNCHVTSVCRDDELMFEVRQP